MELTHEKYKDRFGDAFGTDVKLMFDDEALMGSWSEGFEDVFYARYGYDIRDYMPYVFDRAKMNIDTEDKRKVFFDFKDCIDYLVRVNYLRPMRELIKELFPTLERPEKATWGMGSLGNCLVTPALMRRLTLFRFNAMMNLSWFYF